MVENIALCTRLFVLVCAAVMFVMCPDATSASPITTQVDNEVKHKVLRRLYTPNSQHHQLFTGQPSPDIGQQSGPPRNTETTWSYRKAPSIIDRQPKPPGFTERSFGYNQNSPDYWQSYAGRTRVPSGRQPTNSISTSNNQHVGENIQRMKSSLNYQPTNVNLYNSNSTIIRKSSYKDAASPFFQSSSRSEVWKPRPAQKSYQDKNAPSSFFSNDAADKTVLEPSEVSPFSFQTHTYSSTSLPTQGMPYSGHKETNELPGSWAQSTSRAIQSRKYLSVAGQTAPHAPSISGSFDAYIIKSNPSTEPQRSSITHFSQGWPSTRNGEVPREKNSQSYLFKNSQTSFNGHQSVKTVAHDGPVSYPITSHAHRPSNTPIYGTFSSNFQRGLTKYIKQPSESVSPLYQSARVAQYGAQAETDSSKTSHHTAAETLVETLVLPAPGTDDTRKTLVPIAYADLQGNYATVNEESVPSSPAHATSSGAMQTQKFGRVVKSIFGLRGFKNSMWRSLKEPSVQSSRGLNEGTNTPPHSFDKSKFKIKKVYPSLSQKYSFSQRELFIPTTNTPQTMERNPTAFSYSPNVLSIIKAVKDSRPITSGVNEVQSVIPDSHVGLEGNTGARKLRINRRITGLNGLSNRPLEGAKALRSEPDKSTRVQPDLGGLKPKSSQIWQPLSQRIQRYRYNKTGKIEPGSRPGSMSKNDPKVPLNSSEGSQSDYRFTFDNYKKNHKIYNFSGFQPVRTRIETAFNKTTWRSKEQSENQPISSGFLRSAGPLQTMKASLLKSSLSSTVRGTRVKGKQANAKKLNKSTSVTNDALKVAIYRLPKLPDRGKAFSYSDILGSALFSGVRAKSQTPVPRTREGSIQNIKATTRQEAEAAHWTLNSEEAVFIKGNSSGGSNKPAEDELNHFQMKNNKLDLGDTDLKSSDLIPDNDGSGSGDFDMIDVFSVKSNSLKEDLLELDYLRISTGNVSFKSMNVSNNEK